MTATDRQPAYHAIYDDQSTPVHLKRFLPILILLALATTPSQARRVRTTSRPPVEAKDGSDRARYASTVVYDTVPCADSHLLTEVVCAGFDKGSSSGEESFFISNPTGRDIVGADIMITYYDMKGRQLHRRTEKLTLDIPAGETRKTDIKTWDRQHSFHYYKSNRPARRTSTPFDVRIEIKTLYLR